VQARARRGYLALRPEEVPATLSGAAVAPASSARSPGPWPDAIDRWSRLAADMASLAALARDERAAAAAIDEIALLLGEWAAEE